jgi:AraC-like DNA-binding protein
MRVFGQWALVYLLAGEGDYRDERGTTCLLKPGQWILVFPEIAHTYGPRKGTNWQELYVGFRGPVFDLWRREELFNPAQPVGYWKPPRQGVNAFRDFFGILQKSETTSLKAVCQWQNLLAQIFAPLEAAARKHPAWFELALQLLEPSDPSSRPTLQEIAAACGLGYESFRKKFEARQGIAPGRYALERRIKKACRLLLMQNLTNKEIAELLGFYDEFHFSKAFGQFLGKSPRDYRRENGEYSA